MGKIVTRNEGHRRRPSVEASYEQGSNQGHCRRHGVGHGIATEILDNGILERTVRSVELVPLLSDRQSNQLQRLGAGNLDDAMKIVSTVVCQPLADRRYNPEVSVTIGMRGHTKGQQVVASEAAIEA